MGRKKIFLLSICILTLAGFACNASLPQIEPVASSTSIGQPTIVLTAENQTNIPLTETGVPRIAVDEAKAAFDSGKAVIVDVRSATAYAASHVKGAINIPLEVFETDMAGISLEKGEWIITYCT